MNEKTIPEFDDETIAAIFGTEAAEDETLDRLKTYYIQSKTHKNFVSNRPIRILVGHKGIGKSAIFKIAEDEDKSKNVITVLIHPDDISDLGKSSDDLNEMIRAWKRGLLEIVANKVFSSAGVLIDSKGHEEMKTVLDSAGKFIRFIADIFQKQISEKVDSNRINRGIVKTFLGNRIIDVYIDDLDRGWEGKKEDIQRISALLNAIRDLCNNNDGLRIRLSLRSDVYYLVRTSDESTDKIEGYVVWHSWSHHDMLLMLIKRIEAYFGREFAIESYSKTQQRNLADFLSPVFEKTFQGKGKWENVPLYQVLLTMIRKRPRDLVKLCSMAASNAYENDDKKIGTKNLTAIFANYSQGRLQDTVNEYKSELPEIESLLLNMKPNQKERKEGKGFVYTTPELKLKLNNILQRKALYLKSGKKATAEDLLSFLYKINFITARKIDENGKIVRHYFEEKQYITNAQADFGFNWEIHPAFRWALDPDNSQTVSGIELSDYA